MTAAVYATGGNRCGSCGHEWADEPPPGAEFRREVMGAWVTVGCAKCRPTTERKPSAGWDDREGLCTLGAPAQIVRGAVREYSDGCDWSLTVPGCDGVGGNYGKTRTVDAAKLAAEDALLAIAAAITRTVGR